ncbi:GNAT family N-acetyltransferase [Candidatus Epulonipiscium fishelsonii]|uniref:GNAT family N-acetyltransferase n=1 Tax=Candidatus Epulonipiscium fishelsonii TaxID=77094 RepID=A0ACC8X864_9FIRM|nr:GNAT family N-acetyltransferase [Epulopiscium sp. SCG-D08WGA-EpuloA1]
MKIRKYKTEDCFETIELLVNTIHAVNIKDYTKAQLDGWSKINVDKWNKSFLDHNTLIVEENDIIVGFGDMDSNGYLDRLYVHKDYQGQGIATVILTELELQATMYGISTFTAHASITARAFFEKRGYCIINENKVLREGEEILNFVMKKYSTVL